MIETLHVQLPNVAISYRRTPKLHLNITKIIWRNNYKKMKMAYRATKSLCKHESKFRFTKELHQCVSIRLSGLFKSTYKNVGVLPIRIEQSNVSSNGPSSKRNLLFLSDEGPMLETLDNSIRIGSTPTFLFSDLYLYSAYAANYVYVVNCLFPL